MHRRLALLALVLAIVGCERYRSRAQGPFGRPLLGPKSDVARTTPPAGKSGLAYNSPATPRPPLPPDEAVPVPPRPPEPQGYGIAPPQGPRPPAVVDPDVQPAAGVEADDPPRRKVLPRRNSPAPKTPPPPPPKSPLGDAPAAPAQPSSAAMNLGSLKKLAQAATAKIAATDTYEARFVRRETINDKPGPTEEVIFQFRHEPMSVYMKNVGEVGKGREVVYNPGKFGDKIHVVVGEGDTRFLKPGSKGPSLSPDNPQVRSKSRHTIRESGLGTSAGRFAAAVAKVESGKLPPDALKYAGTVKREEFGDRPLEGVEQTVRAGEEDGLPTGGVRHWFFDAKPDSPSAGLPVLVVLYDDKGKELEYYRYSQVKAPAGLTDADFDPARLGKK